MPTHRKLRWFAEGAITETERQEDLILEVRDGSDIQLAVAVDVAHGELLELGTDWDVCQRHERSSVPQSCCHQCPERYLHLPARYGMCQGNSNERIRRAGRRRGSPGSDAGRVSI